MVLAQGWPNGKDTRFTTGGKDFPLRVRIPLPPLSPSHYQLLNLMTDCVGGLIGLTFNTIEGIYIANWL